jgi:hypothetical protein
MTLRASARADGSPGAMGLRLALALLVALGGALPGQRVAAADFVEWAMQAPGAVPLTSLAQGDVRGARPAAPALVIVASVGELERLAAWLADPALLARLRTIDYTTTLVVAALVGPRPSSGHVLAIQSALLDGDTVRLVVTETAPTPEQPVLDVITYPYHLVTVPRAVLPAGPLRWELVDTAGQTLAVSCGPGAS